MKRTDSVLAEIHKVREMLGRRYGFDVRRIAKALQAKEGQRGHGVVSRPAKRISTQKAS
jgi:hypothetical protein